MNYSREHVSRRCLKLESVGWGFIGRTDEQVFLVGQEKRRTSIYGLDFEGGGGTSGNKPHTRSRRAPGPLPFPLTVIKSLSEPPIVDWTEFSQSQTRN